MKIIPPRMRKCYAWLLLVVSTVQWIGGHICFEVAYFVETHKVMSESEKTISDDIYEETGIEASVAVLSEGQQMRVGTDYANYFAFSKTDTLGTVFYTIDYAPRTATWEQVVGHLPAEQQENAPPISLLKLLFSEFLFQPDDLPKDKANGLATVNFQLRNFIDRLASSPNSPPPDFI